MDLGTYLKTNNISHKEFGASVGASEFGVRKWVSRERTPRREAMLKIKQATAGQVTAADFFSEPAAAA